MSVRFQDMAESTPDYLTNRDLFSNHYLTEHLPDTEVWKSVEEDELESVFQEISDLYDHRKDSVDQYNERQLQRRFIDPILDALGIDYGVEETVQKTQRRPDYGFFINDEAVDRAFDRKDAGGDFYADAIAVGDAKRWNRKLDSQGDNKHSFENPSHQISVYLDETDASWGILTNGRKWRLYHTAHQLDSFYEVDLPELIDACESEDGLNQFKYFYLLFRRAGFVPDDNGECLLDRVLEESNLFAEKLGEDLKWNIYEAIETLANGFFDYHQNDLSRESFEEADLLSSNNDNFAEARLGLVHESSLIYLYRLIFILYAESEGRDLLNTGNDYYREKFSLNHLKKQVADKRDTPGSEFAAWDDELWTQLNDLFELIDQGSLAKGIPRDSLHIPAYNGGLFRTDPDEKDPVEAHFLHKYEVGDDCLAEVIDLLTRREDDDRPGKTFVDYSSLQVRHLGSIYEGLLQYQLNVADEAITVEDPLEGGTKTVKDGEVYLTTDEGERKATGSYYTPQPVVDYIVENTLDPLLEDIRIGIPEDDDEYAKRFTEAVAHLKILDPAMGSGHFLTQVVDHLAHAILDAQEQQASRDDSARIDDPHDIYSARRLVAQQCIYGVDVNSLAVELAKVSLWLKTLAAEQPLAFLDHHLKAGNSLLGTDLDEMDELHAAREDTAQATLSSYEGVRKGTVERLMDAYKSFIAIENEERADVKEMERKYREIEQDTLRNRMVAMANVYTAEHFGVQIPDGAHEDMADGLDNDQMWDMIASSDWFKRAQEEAQKREFFHWKLAYPEAFYDMDGGERNDPGFDAVVGNPPYVSNWQLTEADEDLPEALESLYPRATTGHWDLYVPFVYRGAKMTNPSGRHAFITPNGLATEKYGADLREILIEECSIEKLVTFDEYQIFDQVDRQYLIYVVSPGESDGETEIIRFDGEGFGHEFAMKQERFLTYSNNSFRIDLTADDVAVKEKVDEQSIPLGRLCFVNPGTVAHAADDSPLDFNKDDVISKESGRGKKQYVSGSDITRHAVEWSGEYIDYDSKQEHFHRPKFPAMFESPKVMFSAISGSESMLKSCYDDNEFYSNHSVIHAVQWTPKIEQHRASSNYDPLGNAHEYDLRYVAAMANSRLANYYFGHFLATGTLQGSYSRVSPENIRQLPVPEVQFNTAEDQREEITERAKQAYSQIPDQAAPDSFDEVFGILDEVPHNDVVHDFIAYLTGELIDLKTSRRCVNLNLLDYLGNYENGPELSNHPTSQPAEGVADTLLTKTATDYDGLRIGSLTALEQGDRILVYTTIRYKPEDEDEYDEEQWTEPDQWGFIETEEPILAIEMWGLNETERELVVDFISLVDEQEDGFAGFYESATKNISLLDRIRNILFPNFSDVEDDYEQFLRNRRRAERLEGKISLTDDLIDALVYRLYRLDEREILTVQEKA